MQLPATPLASAASDLHDGLAAPDFDMHAIYTPTSSTTSRQHPIAGDHRPARIVGDAPADIPTTREPSLATTPREFDPRPRSELAMRALNVVIAGTALVLAAPVVVLFAILVKLTSRGPIFYSQTRVGEDRRRGRWNAATQLYDRRGRDIGGRPFTIYKFRSMAVDAEKASGAVWAVKRDPRVTPIGRFMRMTRVDEIPQLLNVLKGDMNIVGPRPERPGIFSRLREDIADYPLRQLARPGITGWAQINHNYDTCIDDVRTKVRYDLEYIQRQSVAEDLRIMLRTVPVMLFRKGAH